MNWCSGQRPKPTLDICCGTARRDTTITIDVPEVAKQKRVMYVSIRCFLHTQFNCAPQQTERMSNQQDSLSLSCALFHWAQGLPTLRGGNWADTLHSSFVLQTHCDARRCGGCITFLECGTRLPTTLPHLHTHSQHSNIFDFRVPLLFGPESAVLVCPRCMLQMASEWHQGE